MGNTANGIDNRQLVIHLSAPKTGDLINLTDKQSFIDIVRKLQLKPEQIHRLQPNSPKDKGFLYKHNTFLYEGDVSVGEQMEGHGRINLIPQRIQYKGMFKSNAFEGQGVLLIRDKDIVLDGRWINGQLVSLSFRQYRNIYMIEIDDVSSSKEQVKVNIRYPDSSVYKGWVLYDRNQQKYLITGKGEKIMKNGNILKGLFCQGLLQGHGQHIVNGRICYQGQFHNGKYQGRGTYYYPNDTELQIDWEDNRPHGVGTFKQKNGTNITVSYQNGRRVYQPAIHS